MNEFDGCERMQRIAQETNVTLDVLQGESPLRQEAREFAYFQAEHRVIDETEACVGTLTIANEDAVSMLCGVVCTQRRCTTRGNL